MPHDNNSSSIYPQTMKMKLCILITGVLLCLPDSCLSLRWLSTPGEILACTGDDVTFHWQYDTQDERVTMIFIINAQTETTFLTYYIDDDYSKTNDEYRGRTEFIEYSQEGTKFILKNVTKNDSVGYIIQLGGIGEKNLANLKVYDKTELKPTLRANNKPHQFDQPLNLTSEDITTVMLSTAQSVPANITISVDGDIVETCTRATVCVYSLSINNAEDIGFEVNYGVCGVITEELAVVSDKQTIPLISSKVENSEAWTTEQSDEMTTFVVAPGDKSNQATAVVPVIVTLIVIILILLVITILYILWYRPKRKRDDATPNGLIESKLFTVFSVIDEKICCCKKRDETLKMGGNPDDDDHENTSLLSDGQVNKKKEPADMTLIDEEGSGTLLTPAVDFAPQDNLSDPNPENNEISIELSSASVPPPTTLHTSMPTPAPEPSTSTSTSPTPEPSTSTSPDALSRIPTVEPTTPISIRKDDGPSSMIDTIYISPQDKPVQVSEEQECHELKSKTRGKNEPKTKKKKEYKQNRSGDSRQSKGRPKSTSGHGESTKISDEAKITLGEARGKPLPEGDWEDEDDETEDKAEDPQENPISLPMPIDLPISHQSADAKDVPKPDAVNQPLDQATNSSTDETRGAMNHLDGQSSPSHNQDKPMVIVNPFNQETSPANDVQPTENKQGGHSANGNDPDVDPTSTNQASPQEVSPASYLDDDVVMEDDPRSNTAGGSELIAHDNVNVNPDATGSQNNDGDGSDDEVIVPLNQEPVAPLPKAVVDRQVDDLTQMLEAM